jgi:hypothetical protein
VVGPGGAAEYSVLPANKWRRVAPDPDADVEYDPTEVGKLLAARQLAS